MCLCFPQSGLDEVKREPHLNLKKEKKKKKKGRGKGGQGTEPACFTQPLLLNDLILEYVEVVGGCHGDDVVLGVPGSVEDLLVEI